ncbi:MAG: biotin transporter BioY [Coriobacteriia bacterium]|nr:biotin transporter BioY [Coriobacteriia bacterium]
MNEIAKESTVRINARLQSLTLIALFAALIAASSLFAAFVYPIPFTLQTLFVILAALLLTPAQATGAMALYVGIGAIGLPVFSGGRGGLSVIVGPTGGYLFGFIVAACVGSYLMGRLRKTQVNAFITRGIVALLVIALVDTFGVAWMMASAGMSFNAAVVAGVVPFIVPDVLKGIVAVVLASALCRYMPMSGGTGK